MNEQEFILLMEEYLDGSITPQGRAALKTEVLQNPARRQLFENQARQHIRLHAQTSRIDFSDTQRIAIMVMDIVEKQKEPSFFMELIRKKTIRERFTLIIQGLRAPPNSPANRLAKAELVRIFGPVSLSVAVNVAALLLLLFWVPYVIPPHPGQDSIEERDIMTINLGGPTAESPNTPEPPASTTPDGQPAPTATPGPAPASDQFPTSDTGAAPDSTGLLVSPEESLIQTPTGPGADPEHAAPLSAPVRPRSLPSGLAQTPYRNRDADTRANLLALHNAPKTEPAVLKALQWLKTHQAADGSWPGQETTAMTGLALLAYLAHGDTPASTEFGDTITRGLKHLLARQHDDGTFSKNVYAHAIATYALAEAYTMTRIMALKTPLDKAAQVIIQGQQSTGGFDYNYLKSPRFDLSVTGWQIQALNATHTADPTLPGLEEARSRASRFLLTDVLAQDGSGFVYDGKAGLLPTRGGRPSMTSVGTLCLQILGKPNSPPVKSGLKLLQNIALEWPTSGKANVYTGYYVAQSKFQSGNKSDWMRWNLHMQRVLLTKQKQDGHWELGDYDNGSHVYTTTLCTLMLEVYYRYLPSYAQRTETAPTKNITSGERHLDNL